MSNNPISNLDYQVQRNVNAEEHVRKYLIPRQMLLSALEYLSISGNRELVEHWTPGYALAEDQIRQAIYKLAQDEVWAEREFIMEKRKQYVEQAKAII